MGGQQEGGPGGWGWDGKAGSVSEPLGVDKTCIGSLLGDSWKLLSASILGASSEPLGTSAPDERPP